MLPFEDYAILLEEAKGCKSALEFGPGISTLALLEAGVGLIDTLEYNPKYAKLSRENFAQYKQVSVYDYENKPELFDLTSQHTRGILKYDVAFVDSPIGSPGKGWDKLPGQEHLARYNTVLYAVTQAKKTLLHDAHRPGEQATLDAMAQLGYTYEIRDTKKGMAIIYDK